MVRPADSTLPKWTLIDLVEFLALTAAVSAVLAAWWIGIEDFRYDYDELLRGHATWLVARGLRPYHDFLETHPPYFALLTSVPRRLPDPCDVLQVLRWVSGVGNLLSLAGLVAVGTTAGVSWRGSLLGLAVVALHPGVLPFLIEFRMDGWGYALAAWGVYGLRRRGTGDARFAAFGLVTGVATLLLCPKLALLAPLVVAAELGPGWRSPRRWARPAGAYLLGAGLAGAVFALYLAAQRIEIGRVYLLLFRLNALINAHSSIRFGMARMILRWPIPLAAIALGAACWVVQWARRRTWPDTYHPALAAWLIAQAVLVASPYKQYFGPWLLFGACFVGFLGQALAARSRWLGMLACVLACGPSVASTVERMQLIRQHGGRKAHCEAIRWMNRVARPEDYIVAEPFIHPVVRRDCFFAWWSTGYNIREVLDAMPSLRASMSEARYRAELEAHPPAFVSLPSPNNPYVQYPEQLSAVLSAFLLERGYVAVRHGIVRVAVRPDIVKDARRGGLLAE